MEEALNLRQPVLVRQICSGLLFKVDRHVLTLVNINTGVLKASTCQHLLRTYELYILNSLNSLVTNNHIVNTNINSKNVHRNSNIF